MEVYDGLERRPEAGKVARPKFCLESIPTVSGLPTELIREIFLFAVLGIGWDRYGDNRFGALSRWESLTLTLSSVCSRWRSIALDASEIWSTFAISLVARAKEPVDLFLERSKNCPLTLYLATREGEESDEVVLRTLISHGNRWSSVNHDNVCDRTGLAILRTSITSLPALRRFTCTPLVPHDNAFNECTSLEELIIPFIWTNYSYNFASLPLENVSHITFQPTINGSFTDILEILQTCGRQLRTLAFGCPPSTSQLDSRRRFSVAQFFRRNTTPVAPVECSPHTFSVDLYHPNGIFLHLIDIFDALTLPALTTLTISGRSEHGYDFHGSWPGSTIGSFFQRSQCTLTSLSLIGIPILTDALLSLLDHTPKLTSLTFLEHTEFFIRDGTPAYNRTPFIEKLCITGAGPVFLPELTELGLHFHGTFEGDLEFVAMVYSRWAIDSSFKRLRRVYLYIRRDLYRDAAMYKPLKKLDEEGLRIVVRGNGKIKIVV